MVKRALVYALLLICGANFLNYLDRQLVSTLETPITDAFGLKDVGFGFLWTLFTVGYMLCAPFVGFLTDRYRRTRLFAVCIFIWSLATVASGFATTRGVLYAARLLTGVGEAGCLIIGPVLISDFFRKESRGRALSYFYLGLPLGGTGAFIFSGLLLDLIGWRDLFLLAGAPGFLVAALIWFLPEPARNMEGQGDAPVRTGIREYVELFRRPELLLVILAQAFAIIIIVPIIHFGVGFFTGPERGMDPEDAKIALGLIALVAGVAGNTISGVIGDRWAKSTPGAYAKLAGIGYLFGFPFLWLGFHAPNPWIFLPAFTLGSFCTFLCMPAVNAHIANVAPPGQRAMAWALAVFVGHLLGDTMSPLLFGKVSILAGRLNAFLIFASALLPAGLCSLAAAWWTVRRSRQVVDPNPNG